MPLRSMKFLLELVSCCGSPESGAASPVAERVEPRTEETRALMRRSVRRKRRGRAAAADDWKPSLCAISEDVVMDKTKSEKERSVKRKSGGSHRDKVRVRSYSRDFGENSVQTIIPTFSATPFMF